MRIKALLRILFFVAVLGVHCATAFDLDQTQPEIQSQPYDAIINLGGDCQVAYQLFIHGLRNYALPFDVLVTPYTALQQMLQNTFEGFLSPDNFELEVTEKEGKHILDKKYGTWLIHDFKLQEDFLKDFDEVSSKYQRRIDRLMNLIQTSNYPLFIRKIITKEQAVELRDLLCTLRQSRPFLLVALDGAEESKSDWHIEGVRNFYLRQLEPYSWKGDPAAWEEIFTALGLSVRAVCIPEKKGAIHPPKEGNTHD